ncbi:MAG: FecR domain-containing protein [Kiritimatiellae bacterium]|nr:FecR domain-containing protein [Kiritimatiellia bacterium]MDD5521233.1 FecR domain-containing protein [Kiritimatiellia bacterium]
MSGSIVSAAPFELAFKLTKILGECAVMAPDAKEFAAAVEGQAYPYGSKIKTGRKSSAIIEFSSGNLCRVLASTVLTVTENAKDKKAKTIKLDEGRIGVELEEKFHENNSLNVETAAAICGAIGCKFTANSTIENDLKVVVFAWEEGKGKITGADFEIPLLEKDDAVSISKAAEKDFIRIKNIKGAFNINLKNSQNEQVSPELKLGYSVKIYREISPNGANILVYTLILTPEGKTDVTYAYSRPLGAPGTTPPGAGKGKGIGKGKEDKGMQLAEGEIVPIATTTTTVPTTTTTTKPPSDILTLINGIPPQPSTITTTIIGGTTRHRHRTTPTPVGER